MPVFFDPPAEEPGPTVPAPDARTFTVRRYIDSYLVQEALVSADSPKEAAELAADTEDSLTWGADPEAPEPYLVTLLNGILAHIDSARARMMNDPMGNAVADAILEEAREKIIASIGVASSMPDGDVNTFDARYFITLNEEGDEIEATQLGDAI